MEKGGFIHEFLLDTHDFKVDDFLRDHEFGEDPKGVGVFCTVIRITRASPIRIIPNLKLTAHLCSPPRGLVESNTWPFHRVCTRNHRAISQYLRHETAS